MVKAEQATEVAIIGAGVTGLAVAYHLGLHNISAVVFEQDSIGSGASAVAPGGVRLQWETPINCAMSRESLAFYRCINEILGTEAKLAFRECGYLFLAHSGAMLDQLHASVDLQNEFGTPSRMATPDELKQLLPALVTDTILGASYCAEDGYFDDPWGVIIAFAKAAQRHRVRLRKGTVTKILRDGEGFRIVLHDGDHAFAERVVVAAGVDSAALVGSLGLDLPIRAEPRYLFYSNIVEDRICDPLVVSSERQFAVKQMANGQFLVSYLGAGRYGEQQTPETWKLKIGEAADELMPVLLDIALTHMVKGYYDMTPDHQPIIGPLPGIDGVLVAAGLSGHGFMMAPAVGKAVADMLRGVETTWYFRSLGLERFREQPLVMERQVI